MFDRKLNDDLVNEILMMGRCGVPIRDIHVRIGGIVTLGRIGQILARHGVRLRDIRAKMGKVDG